MDSARQLIRWGLPGWMTLQFLTLFMMIEVLIESWGRVTPNLFDFLKGGSYVQILKLIDSNILALGVASIPFGFLIYQFYYWVYWYAPLPSLFGERIVAPVDRGKEIIHGLQTHVDFKQIFDHPLVPEGENYTPSPFERFWRLNVKSARVMALYRQNWHLSDSVWYLALSDPVFSKTAEYLEKRNQMLGDIYHSLGACYLSLLAGAFLFGVTFINVESSLDIRNVLGLLLNIACFFIIFFVLRGCRIASFDALLSLKHDVMWYALNYKQANDNKTVLVQQKGTATVAQPGS